MRILLTGSSGQLGKAISHFKPTHVDLISPSKDELNLLDIRECSQIIKRLRPDLVINSAAYTSVDEAENEKEVAFAINSEAPKALAKAIHINGGKLLHLSTDFVFSGNQSTPYEPHDERNPLNIYGLSKASGEVAIQKILDQSNQGVILRTSWLMGSIGRNFALTMLRLHREREQISVVSDQFGSPTTTFSLAQICWRLAELYCNSDANHKKLPSILHWCNAGIASWYDIAIAIGELARDLNLLDRKAEVFPIRSSDYSSKAKRPPFSVLGCERTVQLLGVKQSYWRDALYEILKDVAEQETALKI